MRRTIEQGWARRKAAFAVLPFMLLLSACGGPELPACENKVLARAASPDGSATALLYDRVCEKGADISTHISILGQGEADPAGPGNLFRAQMPADFAAAGGSRAVWAKAEWITPKSLLITSDVRGLTFLATTGWGADVKVHYATAERPRN